MTTTVINYSNFTLPWEATRGEDERFKRILRRLSLIFLIIAIVVPLLPLPEIVREHKEIITPKMAKLILHERMPAQKPPQPVKQEQPPPEKQQSRQTAPAKPKPKRPQGNSVAKMGVAAFSKQLQSLRSSLDVAKLQARNTNIKTGAAARTSRSVLGRENATKTSGGVNSDVMNGNGSGTQLAGRSGVSVSSPIGYGTGGGGGDGDGSGGAGAGSGGRHSSSMMSGRDMESIRRVFEEHKGAIYAIYNRALRRDPGIRGKYVFHIVIEPSGAISAIKLVSSELGSGSLEQKLLARIRIIDFGPDDVLATPVNYKFDFLPS
jgi:outer membrane biosynthesis protein TonB